MCNIAKKNLFHPIPLKLWKIGCHREFLMPLIFIIFGSVELTVSNKLSSPVEPSDW